MTKSKGDKKKIGRPKLEGLTEPKTYSFFSKDIEIMQRSGMTPKQVFRLGIIAHDNNPQMMGRIKEQDTKISSMQELLTKTSARAFKLESILEDFLGDKLDQLILKNRAKK